PTAAGWPFEPDCAQSTSRSTSGVESDERDFRRVYWTEIAALGKLHGIRVQCHPGGEKEWLCPESSSSNRATRQSSAIIRYSKATASTTSSTKAPWRRLFSAC